MPRETSEQALDNSLFETRRRGPERCSSYPSGSPAAVQTCHRFVIAFVQNPTGQKDLAPSSPDPSLDRITGITAYQSGVIADPSYIPQHVSNLSCNNHSARIRKYVITYAAIAFAVIVIVTLGMALYGWHRHLRNEEDVPAPHFPPPRPPRRQKKKTWGARLI